MMVLLPTVLSHLKTTTDLISVCWIQYPKKSVIISNRALCFYQRNGEFAIKFKTANNADTSRIEVPETIISMYHEENIHSRKLDNQLQMLPDLVNAFKKSQNLPKLTVTKVSTIADMLVTVPMAKDIFSEIDKILQLYLTIPVTTCTAESFSSLRHINLP